MANQQVSVTKSNETSPESQRRKTGLTRWSQGASDWPSRYRGPFSLMRRLSDDMDRLFEGFLGRDTALSPDWPSPSALNTAWPEIEVFQKDDKLVVQADIPGLNKDDVKVEVREDGELCISGERRSESERNEGGFYRSERSYGSFCRIVPLPEGAKPDTATATFENGVLKVEVETPPETGKRRRIEVK